MRALRCMLLLVVLIPGIVAAAPVLIYSSGGAPWGSSSPANSMDTVFGVEGWDQEYYQSADVSTLFAPSTNFIYMAGGADNDSYLNAFLATNAAAVRDWVYDGGRLLIESAGWRTPIDTQFGINLLNGPSTAGTAVNPGHPIFQGPYAPVGTAWSGSAFSHYYLQGGGYTPLIAGTTGDVLGLMYFGNGLVMLSGITANNYHTPQPQAANLSANVVYFAAYSTPEPATLALIGLGLAGFGMLRRRLRKS